MAARCRADLPHDNPGVALGAAMGALARGRPRQADVRHRARPRAPRRLAGAAHRRVAPASTASASCPWTASRSATARSTAATGSSCASGSTARRRRGTATRRQADALAAAGHPVIDIRLDGRRMGRRRVLPLGGRDRRSRARCWASTRSTSPTSPSRRRTRARVLDEHRAARATCRGRAAARSAGDPAACHTRSATAGCASRAEGDRRRRVLRAHLARVRRDGYLALQAYIAPTERRTDALRAHPGAAARPDAPRDDPRLRPALPALDRPAPQGRPADRAASSS